MISCGMHFQVTGDSHGASAFRESAIRPSAAGTRHPRLMAEKPKPEIRRPWPSPVTWKCLSRLHLCTGRRPICTFAPRTARGAAPTRYNYVVTRSRPYPYQVLAVSGWRLAVGGWERRGMGFLSSIQPSLPPSVIYHRFSHLPRPYPLPRFNSALHSVLNAVLHSVLHSVLNAVLHSSHPHFAVATSPRRSSTTRVWELPASSVTPTRRVRRPTSWPLLERSVTPRSRLS